MELDRKNIKELRGEEKDPFWELSSMVERNELMLGFCVFNTLTL